MLLTCAQVFSYLATIIFCSASLPSFAATETKTLTLMMNVKSATCTTAVVSDVNFNRQTANDVLSGNISESSVLSIDCSSGGSAPDSLKLRLVPANAFPDQASDGYIKADGRNDIGYRFTWGDSTVGNVGDGVPMDTELGLKSPIQGTNDIKFDVKPVALNGQTTLASGSAGTSVIIKITYS